MAMRKAVLFTLDAIFASFLLLTVALVYSSGAISTTESAPVTVAGDDLLQSLNHISLQELSDPIISDTINDTLLTENDSLLYAIGYLWSTNDSRVSNFSQILNDTIPPNTALELRVESDLILSAGTAGTGQVRSVARQQITGIDEGVPIAGSTGAAFLQKLRNKYTSAYAFFGGFVGQGNISQVIALPSDVNASRVKQILLEADVADEFSVYMNNQACGSYTPASANMTADRFNLSDCIPFVQAGNNVVNITFDDLSTAYIAGGFIRIDYTTDTYTSENSALNRTRYDFPGVNGVVNLYDAITVPAQALNISARLHYSTDSSNVVSYLTVGEIVVYESNRTGDVTIELDTYNFTNAGVNLDQISSTTVPIRFASYNSSIQLVSGVANADVVIITDYSGSMQLEVNGTSTGDTGDLTDCEGDVYNNPNIRRSHLARCLNKELVQNLLNYTGNRVYPVHFYNDQVYTYNNPDDEVALVGHYETFTPTFPQNAGGGTGLAPALSAAYNVFDAHSGPNRTRVVVFMTDGLASHCALDPDVYWQPGPWICRWWGCGSWQPLADVNSPQCDNRAEEFHVQSSCSGTQTASNCQVGGACSAPLSNTESVALDLYNDFNATIHSVAFGPIGTCDAARTTLQNVASLSNNGTYFTSANISGLIDVYTNITEQIISVLELSSQSVIVPEDITTSRLYNDSFIEVIHEPVAEDVSANEIEITRQSDPLSGCSASWDIPAEVRLKQAVVTSYSGEYWTDYLRINDHELFNLSYYLVPYARLGDPFTLSIPPSRTNDSNTIVLRTGESATNSTGCSANNTVIYTVYVPSSTTRTPVREKAEGCQWTIETEQGSTQVVTLPTTYVGPNTCEYTSTGVTYDFQDALQDSVHSLLDSLDFDDDGRIFVELAEEDLQIIITQVSSVPYMWGPVLMTLEVTA